MRLIANWVVDQEGRLEIVPVPVADSGVCLYKVDVSIVPYGDCLTRKPFKFVEMILIKIGSELYFVHMVAVVAFNRFFAYRGKPMIVRIALLFCNFNTAQYLVHMLLWITGAAVLIIPVHKIPPFFL